MKRTDPKRGYWTQDHYLRPFNHPIVNFFSEQRIAEISRHIELSSIETLLDVGCGIGASSYYWQGKIKQVICGDFSSSLLKSHPLRGRAVQMDALELPFGDKSFDLVNCWELLHHLDRPEIALKEMVRVSRKYVVVFEPNRNHPLQFLFALINKDHRLVMRYSRRYLESSAHQASLKEVCLKTMGWIFPNRTPSWLFPLLKSLPFEARLGISHLLIGKVK